MKSRQIKQIEAWAREIAGDHAVDRRFLILKWSQFTGRSGDKVTIKGREWDQVSEGWVTQTWRKAKKAYENHQKKIAMGSDLFEPAAEPVILKALLPPDGPDNHPPEIPF